MKPAHQGYPDSQSAGIRDSLRGLAGAGLQYLSVRGQLAATEARIELKRSTRGIIFFAAAVICSLIGTGAAAVALIAWLAGLTGSLAGGALLAALILALIAGLLLLSARRAFAGHRFFRNLREELNADIQCLTRNS